MADPVFFTMEGNALALIGDQYVGDPDRNPDLLGIRGTVIFTPGVSSTTPLLGTDLTPNPALLAPQPITAQFSEDGTLIYNGNVGVRLPANGVVLGLAGPYSYTVSFSNLYYGDTKIPNFASFSFNAPPDDRVLNLVDVARVPNSVGSGMSRGARGYTPWFVLVPLSDPPLYQAMDPGGPVGDPIPLTAIVDPEQIQEVVDNQVPILLATQIPAALAAQIPALLGVQVPALLATQVPPLVAGLVPAQLTVLVPPAVAAAIAADGTVAAAAAAAAGPAVAAATAAGGFLGNVHVITNVDQGIAFAFTDDDSHGQASWLAIDFSGGPPPHTVAALNAALNVASQITAGVNAAVIAGGYLSGTSGIPSEELAFSIFAGSTGQRSDLELGFDGKITQRVIDDWKTRMGVYVPPTNPVPEIETGGRIFLDDVASSTRVLLGTVPSATNPKLLSNTAVRFSTSTVDQWLDTSSTTPKPMFPIHDIAMWGDSLTFTYVTGAVQGSPTIPQTIAADLGVACYNGGQGSHGSAEIATRQGGLQPLITLTGGQIPSGSTAAITLTAIAPTDGWQTSTTNGGTLAMHGTLAGVAGTLQHILTGTLNFAFKPDSAPGVTVVVPAGTPFIGDEGAGMRDRLNIIWAGTNNRLQPAAIARDVASMVAWQTPYTKRFLVINNTVSLPDAAAINAALLAAFPNQYVDLRGYLINNGLAAAGITPTSGDTAAIAAGNIPPSLQWDGLHFTQVSSTVIAHYLSSIITAKKWI